MIIFSPSVLCARRIWDIDCCTANTFLSISFWIAVFFNSNFTCFWWYFFSRFIELADPNVYLLTLQFMLDGLLAISKSYNRNIQKQNDQRGKVAVNTISKNKFYLFDGRSLSSIISTFLVCTHRSVRKNCKWRRLIIIWPHSY